MITPKKRNNDYIPKLLETMIIVARPIAKVEYWSMAVTTHMDEIVTPTIHLGRCQSNEINLSDNQVAFHIASNLIFHEITKAQRDQLPYCEI